MDWTLSHVKRGKFERTDPSGDQTFRLIKIMYQGGRMTELEIFVCHQCSFMSVHFYGKSYITHTTS